MAYKSCEDCGSRITSSGLCSYCDEEALIIEQEDREYQEYEAMGYPDEEEIITNFSDEFMERANKQFERAKGRQQNKNLNSGYKRNQEQEVYRGCYKLNANLLS